MSIYDDDLDDEGGNGGNDDAQNGPKALRDQLKKLQKQLNELQKERDELRTRDKARTLSELLKEAGAPERIAKYASRDIEDVSKDAVQNWLQENGADFGWSPAGDDDGDGDDLRAEQADRIHRSTQIATPPHTDTNSELLTALKTLSHEQLRERGLI